MVQEHIHVMHYNPEYYQIRDCCKAIIQTGDYGTHIHLGKMILLIVIVILWMVPILL